MGVWGPGLPDGQGNWADSIPFGNTAVISVAAYRLKALSTVPGTKSVTKEWPVVMSVIMLLVERS